MQHGTVTKLEYQGTEYALGGMEFVEIEDKIHAVESARGIDDAEREQAIEWIKYNGLFNAGHFVSKPNFPEPTLSETFNEQDEDADDDFVSDTVVQPSKVEVWTQSRILAEREKLVRREEQIIKKEKEKLIKLRKQAESMGVVASVERDSMQFYHPDGTPYTDGQYATTAIVLFMVCFLVAIFVGLMIAAS